MNRVLFIVLMVLGTSTFLFGLQTANAEFMGTAKDSADFTWNYEMDVDPTGQNLDGNACVDWVESKDSATYDGVMHAVVNTDGRWSLLCSITADGDYIWSNITHATGFTMELKVKTGGDHVWNGYTGGLYIRLTDSNDSENFSDLVLVNEGTIWDASYRQVIGTDENDDDFHVFRIAQEANGTKYYVWRDGELLYEGNGLSSKNTAATKYRVFIGDLGGAVGPYEIDYIRLTTGGYAPVPEPTTLALLATGLIGLLAYAWRKRK